MITLKTRCLAALLTAFLAACSGLPEGDRSQMVDRSFNHSLGKVRQGALVALGEMDIMVIESRRTETGQTIQAATFDLDLTIDLRIIDNGRTQVSVYSRRGEAGKKTAEQILERTEQFMQVALKAEGAF